MTTRDSSFSTNAIRSHVIRLIRQWSTQPQFYTPHPASTWNAPVIIIDGRSGSGKSTLATMLVNDVHTAGLHGMQLTGPDLWFPGWHGLAEGTQILHKLLTNPHHHGFHTWDWTRNRWGHFQRLDRSRPLLIEGCASLTPTTARIADLSIWVEADDTLRRERALTRDGDIFTPWWDTWAEQEETHLRTHQPHLLADITVHNQQVKHA